MLPPDKKLVLSVEQSVSATSAQPSTTIGGFVDCIVVVAASDDAGEGPGQLHVFYGSLTFCRGLPKTSPS